MLCLCGCQPDGARPGRYMNRIGPGTLAGGRAQPLLVHALDWHSDAPGLLYFEVVLRGTCWWGFSATVPASVAARCVRLNVAGLT